MKKMLITCIASLSLLFIFVSFVLFGQSLLLSAKTSNDRDALLYPISDFAAGEFRYIEQPPDGHFLPGYKISRNRILLIHDWDGQIYAHLLPSNHDGSVVMPDTMGGWYGYYFCQNFSPELDAHQQLKRNGYIRCFDQGQTGWNTQDWVWTYDGKLAKSLFEQGRTPLSVPMVTVPTEKQGDWLKIYLWGKNNP